MIPFSNLTAKSLNLTTALHFAVLSGNVEICELIIARQEFLHFPESRSEFRPDPEDTLPDLDGQQAQNILNHP